MACHQIIEQWLLHGAGLQLQQSTTVRYNSTIKTITILPILETTIISCQLLQSGPNTIELPIKSLLYAKLHILHLVRTLATVRRVTKGFEGVCQLIRPISILETSIYQLDHNPSLGFLYTTAFKQQILQLAFHGVHLGNILLRYYIHTHTSSHGKAFLNLFESSVFVPKKSIFGTEHTTSLSSRRHLKMAWSSITRARTISFLFIKSRIV